MRLTAVVVVAFAAGLLPGCLEAVTSKERMRFDGRSRTYRLVVPERVAAPAKPVPLVVVLHGAFATAAKMEAKTGFSELAEKAGFIVAYPEGIGLFSFFRHWNAGHCCGKALKQNVDDVGFVVAVIEEVATRYKVDRQRVYVVGDSNGGMLAYRIAAERTSLVGGVGVVAGSIGGRDPKGVQWNVPAPGAPIAVVVVHGRQDDRLPYGEADPAELATVPATESVRFWIEANGCNGKPQHEKTVADGRVLRQEWTGCNLGSNVVFYSVDQFGHDWPGGPLAVGEGADRFDAATAIWDYLSHKRRWRKIETGTSKMDQ